MLLGALDALPTPCKCSEAHVPWVRMRPEARHEAAQYEERLAHQLFEHPTWPWFGRRTSPIAASYCGVRPPPRAITSPPSGASLPCSAVGASDWRLPHAQARAATAPLRARAHSTFARAATELHAMGLQQPPISAYANVTVAAARLLHFQHVFLQTAASMQAERDFTHALSLHGLHESPHRQSAPPATRGLRLRQSGRLPARTSRVIATVNARTGSLAAVFLSLANSMWTFLQRSHGTTVHLEPIACSQAGPQRSAPSYSLWPESRRQTLRLRRSRVPQGAQWCDRCNGNKMESTAEELPPLSPRNIGSILATRIGKRRPSSAAFGARACRAECGAACRGCWPWQ